MDLKNKKRLKLNKNKPVMIESVKVWGY